jgi:hypothetical protein
MSGFAKVIGSVMLAGAVAATASPQSDHPGLQPFDVASVKPNKSGAQPYSNFPLNAGESYIRNGGLLQGNQGSPGSNAHYLRCSEHSA